jgi:hypothetical protein
MLSKNQKIAPLVEILQDPGRHVRKMTRGVARFDDKSASDRRKQINEALNSVLITLSRRIFCMFEFSTFRQH